MRINYKNVKFFENKIVLESKKGIIQILRKDIHILFYAKVSFKNFFDLAYSGGIGMGILYVATKEIKKLKDTIQIKIPYEELEKIPNKIFEKIDFFRIGDYSKIYSLK